MIFTVEPGLYFPKDNNKIPEKLRGIAVRIEDDILITKVGHDNLTSSIPKEVKEIEDACEVNFKEFIN
jgi:Xaa-Pro aminopeptidase